MKRAGLLDTRVALQRKGTSYNNIGEPVETWSSIAVRWAALQPLTGTETNSSEQWVAREQTQFTVRWSLDIADFSPLDRLVCPASDAGASPENVRSVYDVIAVHMLGRNEDMRIVAARRVG